LASRKPRRKLMKFGEKESQKKGMIYIYETIWKQQLLLTADKREVKNFPKLPSATSFILRTLGEIPKAFLIRSILS
jgi:hypothetical protein